MHFTATKNKFIFCILLFLCSNFVVSQTIEIHYNTFFPTIELQIGEKKFTFSVDTGSNNSFISFNVIKELEIDKETFFQQFMNSTIPEDATEVLNKYNDFNNFALQNDIPIKDFPAIYLDFNNLEIDKFRLGKLRFYYYRNIDERVFSSLNIDGILGMNFMRLFNNLTINYPKKTIYLNSNNCTVNNKVQMVKNKESQELGLRDNLLYLDIFIENVCHFFTIDTGAISEFILISPESDSELEESNINANDDSLHPTYFYKDIQIGNIIFNDIKTCYTTYSGYYPILQDKEKWEKYKLNCLGYALFKDHIIQFDFENNTFGIE